MMHFKFSPQGGAQSSTVVQATAQGPVIDGTLYQIPADLVTLDPVGPIMSGVKRAEGWHLVVLFRYSDADSAIWETAPYRGSEEEVWEETEAPADAPVIVCSGKTAQVVDTEALTTLKASLCARIEARKDPIMRAGFDYLGDRMQGDAEAQANLMAWVLLNAQGGLSFPRQWRRADNTFLTLASSADLMALAGAMADFKDGVYSGIFVAKDSIRASSDAATAQAIFDGWAARFGF